MPLVFWRAVTDRLLWQLSGSCLPGKHGVWLFLVFQLHLEILPIMPPLHNHLIAIYILLTWMLRMVFGVSRATTAKGKPALAEIACSQELYLQLVRSGAGRVTYATGLLACHHRSAIVAALRLVLACESMTCCSSWFTSCFSRFS
ncbi:hypothetical protein MRX96_020061 [Rhipicephalus microplus]